MPVTTVLSDEGTATIVSGGNDNEGFGHRFSWSAAFAGAILATAVTFFLLALGAGFGLTLTPVQQVATPAFLSLGAVYFLAAQAFGFAAGGHLAGRLIGPARETAKEEEFRSAAHGLIVWALAVVATAALIAIGGMAAGGSAVAVAASSNKFGTQPSTMTSDYVAYWVDILFRPGPTPSQASLGGVQYAQANTGNATDAAPQLDTNNPPPANPAATPSPDFPDSAQPGGADVSAPKSPTSSSVTIDSGAEKTPPASRMAPRDTLIPPTPTGFAPPASLNADKSEVTRIVNVGMMNNARLNQYDKDRIAALVAQDTGISLPGAQRRVDNAEMRMHNDTVQTAETERKIARYASLWIAASLLFGAIVAAAAAMSARWKDDAITFGWPRHEPD